MAFAFPIILVFVLLIVYFGFALDRREVVQHAVREGARYAAVGNDVNAVTSHTSKESGGALSSIQVCYIDMEDANSNPGNAGDNVRVSGEYTHDFTIGSGSILGVGVPTIVMTPSSQARLEKSVSSANQCPP